MNWRFVLVLGCALVLCVFTSVLADIPRSVWGRIGLACTVSVEFVLAMVALSVVCTLIDARRKSKVVNMLATSAASTASTRGAAPPEVGSGQSPSRGHTPENQELLLKLHTQLMGAIDPDALDAAAHDSSARRGIEDVVSGLLEVENPASDDDRRKAIISEVVDGALEFGPISVLLNDPTISDILVNSPSATYVERGGQLYRAQVDFGNGEHLDRVIARLFSKADRHQMDSALLRGSLADGSRLEAVLCPIAVGSPVLSIRRFGRYALSIEDLVAKNVLTPAMAELVKSCIKARLNILFSGGTGGGRTTLLNCFSKAIPDYERIIAIGALRLSGEHVVRFEPPSEQTGAKISLQELIQQAIRMRPDRILLEEVRGPEAFDLIQAMNSSIDGSLAGIHSNSPREALSRLEMMMHFADTGADPRLLRREIGAAIDLIIQSQRFSDGTRRVTHVTECTGFERDQLLFQDIALFEKTGITEPGKVMGRFRMTGIQPLFLDRLRACGVTLPRTFFDPGVTLHVN